METRRFPDQDITLFLEDCQRVLPELPDDCVDSVIADPPYGVQTAPWDSEIPPQSILTECLRISRGPVIWFGAAPIRCIIPTMQYDPPPDRCIIWHVKFTLSQTAAHGMYYKWHPIWCWRLPNQSNGIITMDVVEASLGTHWGWYHPHTKPIDLMTRLVTAFGGQSVLDPFMGSGSTGVACAMYNVGFIGIENDPAYFEIAENRIELECRRPRLPLFEGNNSMAQLELFPENNEGD